jgi:hypothetical protein
MSEKKYQKLLDFISYFKDDKIHFCQWQGGEKDAKGVITMPYPVYDEKLSEFIDSVYDSGIMMGDYLGYFKEQLSQKNDVNEIIKNANLDTLRAVLTFYVRQERFGNGLWELATRDKVFLNILLRLEIMVKMTEKTNSEINDKKEYIARQLARTHNKRYENYVITRIWHKLDRLDVKIVTQQYVSRPDGYALVDLYLPQVGLFIEIDEGHHLRETNIAEDKIRERDVISVTDNQIVRIDVTKDLEDINNCADEVVTLIQTLINE